MPFAGDVAPTGFLLCNGQAVSRTRYCNLFNVVGTKYGNGDGTTTFNLPNLVERFVEGGTVSGSEKEAGLPNIIGDWRGQNFGAYNLQRKNGATTSTLLKYVINYDKEDETDVKTNRYEYTQFNASQQNPVYGKSNTVQPASVTMIYIIKT